MAVTVPQRRSPCPSPLFPPLEPWRDETEGPHGLLAAGKDTHQLASESALFRRCWLAGHPTKATQNGALPSYCLPLFSLYSRPHSLCTTASSLRLRREGVVVVGCLGREFEVLEAQAAHYTMRGNEAGRRRRREAFGDILARLLPSYLGSIRVPESNRSPGWNGVVLDGWGLAWTDLEEKTSSSLPQAWLTVGRLFHPETSCAFCPFPTTTREFAVPMAVGG